jgi:hypothetical protein
VHGASIGVARSRTAFSIHVTHSVLDKRETLAGFQPTDTVRDLGARVAAKFDVPVRDQRVQVCLAAAPAGTASPPLMDAGRIACDRAVAYWSV